MRLKPHPHGIVYAMPGMLIGASEGRLPPDDELIKHILDGHLKITPWDEIDDEILTDFIKDLETD